MFGITPAFSLCEEALIKHRIPWAACQLTIQPLNVNHIWQTGSLRCARVFCWLRLFVTDTVFGIYGAHCKSSLSSFLQVSGLSAGETTLTRVSGEAPLENGAILRWSKAHIIFLIKEWSAEAQRQNSSHRKVTCNDDPSWWIWGLSFQYPVPWLMQGHIYLKMLRLPYNKSLMRQGAPVLSYLYCQFEQLNFYYYAQIRETGIHVFHSLTYNRSNLKTWLWVTGNCDETSFIIFLTFNYLGK